MIRNCLEAVLAALLFLLELCSFKHLRRRGKNTSAAQSAFEKCASQAIGKTKPYKKAHIFTPWSHSEPVKKIFNKSRVTPGTLWKKAHHKQQPKKHEAP